MSASAAARATVLGEKKDSLCQSNPLAKTGVPDASAVMIHTERGWACFGTLGHQTLTCICCTVFFINIFTSETIMQLCIFQNKRRIFSVPSSLYLSSLYGGSAELVCCLFRCAKDPV